MSKIHRMTREPVNDDVMQLEVGFLSLFYLRFLGLYFLPDMLITLPLNE
jgi:hypothetical protein